MLFMHANVHVVMQNRKSKLKRAIQELDRETVEGNTEQALVDRLAQQHSLDVPILDAAAKYALPPEEANIAVQHSRDGTPVFSLSGGSVLRRGLKITVVVPFKGDARCFQIQPTMFDSNPPTVEEVTDEDIRLVFRVTEPPFDIDSACASTLSKINRYLESLRGSAEQLNAELRAIAVPLIRQKKQEFAAHSQILNALTIPVRNPVRNPASAPTPESVKATQAAGMSLPMQARQQSDVSIQHINENEADIKRALTDSQMAESKLADRPIRVFISYSWDSEEHKAWAVAFAKKLRDHGIDAIIDQMQLGLGARSPEFMEQSVSQSDRVLVICTEGYKQRFDKRQGGAGYEGHIISAEMIGHSGTTKFVPILRKGDWVTALPTALLGVFGVDLRMDSGDEFRKLIRNLYGLTEISPLGRRPLRLDNAKSILSEPPRIGLPSGPEAGEYLEQRRRLPETTLLEKIWSKPFWKIWIRPTEFKPARFRSVEMCEQFILGSEIIVSGWYSFPSFDPKKFEMGKDSISAEIEHAENNRIWRAERWTLFQSAQFIMNRSFDQIPQLGERIHVLEILDTVTAAIEFAARMAEQRVLSRNAAITFSLRSVAGRLLTWPQDTYTNAVPRECWAQDDTITNERAVDSAQLTAERRELALQIVLEILTQFGCTELPLNLLESAQKKRFG